MLSNLVFLSFSSIFFLLFLNIYTGNPYTLTQAKPDSANGESSIYHISMSDMVGKRPTMEDTFCVCPRLGGVEGREAFAIFDGHAGR